MKISVFAYFKCYTDDECSDEDFKFKSTSNYNYTTKRYRYQETEIYLN